MPRSKSGLSPRKTPRQRRSNVTVTAILEAATRILERGVAAEFNTNRVAEVAGVSVGSLYQYFPNKDALLAALIADTQERLACAVEQCVEDCAARPLPTALAALVDIAIGHQWQRPLLAAALDRAEQRLAIEDVLASTWQRLVVATMRLLENHRDEVTAGDPLQRARDCLTIVKALVEAEHTDSRRADLNARVVRALLGYLARDGR